MTILRVTGQLIVRVDEVDIEQVALEQPRVVEGFPVALRAMVAALAKDDVKSLQRHLYKCHHTLEYVSSEFVSNWHEPENGTVENLRTKWLITFKIREKHAHEKAVALCD